MNRSEAVARWQTMSPDERFAMADAAPRVAVAWHASSPAGRHRPTTRWYREKNTLVHSGEETLCAMVELRPGHGGKPYDAYVFDGAYCGKRFIDSFDTLEEAQIICDVELMNSGDWALEKGPDHG